MLLKLQFSFFFHHQNTFKCSCRDQKNQHFLRNFRRRTPLSISFMGPGYL